MTKKLLFRSLLFLAMLLAGVNSWGQTTIAKQDFEASPATPVWSYSNSNGAVSTTNTGTPAARIRNGVRSFQVNNQTSTVTFGDVNVSGYTGVKVVVRISSVSTNGTNGADGTDYVRAFVKLNAAAFANNTQALADIAVNGDTNARWGYNTTGVTTTAGTNTVVAGTPGTNQGTVYSTLTINIPDGTTTVGLRLNILNNAAEEVWNVDDVEITGTAVSTGPTAALAGTLTETNLNGATATVTLTGDTYAASLSAAGFTLNNAPSGVTISSVNRTSDTAATLNLSYSNTDFDANVTTFNVTVATSQLTTSTSALTTNNVTITAVAESITPSPTTLTGLTYSVGSGPSTAQSVTLSTGNNLQSGGGTITINGSTNYEVSTTSATAGFGTSASIAYTGTGTLASTTVWVRLKGGLSAGTYNSESIIISGGKASATVTASGSVTAPVISAALAGTLTEPTLTAGTATATVTLTNDTYAASLATAGFTLNNAPAGLSLSSVERTSNTVATLHFTYTGDIDSNVTNFNVTVATSQLTTSASALTTGNLTISAVTETLTPSPTSLTSFSYASGAGPSAAQSFTLSSGDNLQAGGGTITITAPSNYEVSTTSATTGFGSSATLTYTGTGTISPNQAWVRLKAGLSIGSYSQSVTIAGGKATTSVTVSGTVIAPPPVNDECTGATALTVDAAAIQGTLQNATQSLAGITCGTSTGNADDDVWYSFTTAAAGSYTITVDGGDDLDMIIDLRSGACNGTNIACMDSTIDNDEVLTHTLAAATTYYIRVYEYGTLSSLVTFDFNIKVAKDLDAPVATAATDVSTTGFTANWNAVADAASYRLDVSTLANFGTTQTTQGFESTTFPPSGWTQSGWVRSTSTGDYAVGSAAATATSQNGSLTTAAIANPALVTFYLGRSGNSTPKTLYVEVSSTSQTSGFTTVATFDHNNVPVSSYNQYSVDLSAYSSSNTVYIRFRKESSTTSPWRLDEVVITSQLPMVTGYNNRTVNGTSEAVTGLTPGTTYYYRVRSVNGATISPNSNTISVVTGITNTWNGVAWSAGSAPTMTDEAVINGDYNTANTEDGPFSASLLSVTNGKLTVASGTYITVEGAITVEEDAEMEVQSNGCVIQVDEDAVNTGDVVVFRETSLLKRLDYKLWSSPVAGQNLLAFTPQTDTNRFYIYNPQTNQYNSVVPSSSSFALGKGYLIRVPNTHPATTPTVWAGKFEGTLNNGAENVAIEVNALNSALSFNAIGNPYASPVSADDFISANSANIDGTLYFWRKTNGTLGDAYATYNAGLGGVTTNPDAPAPNGFIQVGQGFIVNALPAATQVVFNNEMRVADFGNQVFRMNAPAQAHATPAERHRVWLNLTNNAGVFSQTLIGYATGATNGADMGMDSKYLGNNTAALYSVINGSQYAIQGRAVPFTTTDVVPMGYKAIDAGSYTIAIDHMDGLFAEGQSVYLKDNTTGTIHNLSEGAYMFASDAGTFGNRFEIMFTNTVLGTDVPVLTAESVAVYKDGNVIKVNTGTTEMAGVTVYDMRGRQLANVTGLATTETVITGVNAQQQVLIVQVTTKQHGVVTKKIVF
jgi:hypothetical protein